MTVLDLIDACVQRRYAWWAMTGGSRVVPNSDSVQSFRRDVDVLLRQCRYEGGLPLLGEQEGGDDVMELRRQVAGLEWLLDRVPEGA